MRNQLSRLGLGFERIDAVLGANLSRMEINKAFCKIRSFCAMMRKLRVGEIGCALSHLSVYRKMIDRQIQYALVLEDDVVLADNFIDIVEKAVGALIIDKPMVILLSALSTSDTFKCAGLQKVKKAWGADAYLITLPAAKSILHANYPIVIPADQWGTWAGRNIIELYRMWPTVAWQDRAKNGTEIAVNARPWPIPFRFVYKFFRLVGLMIDEIWYRVSGK